MDPAIRKLYGNQVRVRACGLCWQDEALLMVNHRGLTPGDFWAPPGGGVEFGESVEHCLRKEFQEETGLEVSVERFMFGCEYIHAPLHAIELFFEVSISGGTLRKGEDPELAIISDVRFMTTDMLKGIPKSSLHGVFRLAPSPESLKTLTGFFRI